MTASEMYRNLGLGVELCRTYLSFKHVSKECPVGPIVAATENLAEALRSFGYCPDEAEIVVRRWGRTDDVGEQG